MRLRIKRIAAATAIIVVGYFAIAGAAAAIEIRGIAFFAKTLGSVTIVAALGAWGADITVRGARILEHARELESGEVDSSIEPETRSSR